MKVVRIIARLNVGGPARHVVWLTDELRRAGHQTILVCGVVPPGEEDMSYFAAAHKVRAEIIPEMSREIAPRDVITVWKLYRLFVRERPDVVHTHTAKAGTVGRTAGLLYRWLTPGALAGRPRRCAFVHTYHGHIFHSYYGRLKTRVFLQIERLLARLATDRIVVISAQQRREIHEQFGVGSAAQLAVIPLGIDTALYQNWSSRRQALRREINAGETEVLIGIVGRLTEVKNHRLFLEAAARFKKDYGTRGVRFVVIGDGHLRQDLEEQAQALKLADDVLFLGARQDSENFYPGLDVVALTSVNEGTPLTLIEAMANARPVVATAVGGVVDLIGPRETPVEDAHGDSAYTICERGVLVASQDARGFSAALDRVIRDAALRDQTGARGEKFVTECYTKSRLAADVLRLYEETIAPGAAAPRAGHANEGLRRRTSEEIGGG